MTGTDRTSAGGSGRHTTWRWVALVALVVALVVAACGDDTDTSTADTDSTEPAAAEATSDDSDGSATDESAEDAGNGGGEPPTVVVTTNILGDVVGELVGDQADVITIMPVGADPHDFQPSAEEVNQILEADALIVNGSDFEEGLIDVIGSAVEAGVPTHEAIDGVETIEFGEEGHGDDHSDEEHSDEEHSDEEHSGDDHSDEEHSDEEHSDEEHSDEEHSDHNHDGADPHFFTDPARMADAVGGIGSFLAAELSGLDQAALDSAVADYVTELESLDTEVAALMEAVPAEQRVLVTNHEVFGYFADRYEFEVVGTIIPSGSTAEGASAGELADLAGVIEQEGVPAIFADTSSSDQLAETLAAEVGDVEIVELYTESLGEPDSDGGTYLSMVRTNASRISAALS